MLQTALHDWHASHGGRMVDFAGWHMPVQYSSIVDEHHSVRNQVGLFDIAHMGRLWFSGPEAISFLDAAVTNHVARMTPGMVRYSLVCRDDGGILDDILIYRFDSEILLVVNASNRAKIVDWLRKDLPGRNVEMTDLTEQTCMAAVQGPQAVALLQPLTSLDLGGMKYYSARQGQVLGIDAVVSRTGYTGEDGFEIIVPNDQGERLWSTLVNGTGTAVPMCCGLGCRDTLRLEAAMPLYGHEMDESVDPITAGLAFGVKLDKGEFVGKEAILAAKARTDRPQRVGLRLEGKRIARQGAELFAAGRRIGHVTSGTFSPTLEQSIAMGYVSADCASPGTELEVDIRGKREPARIVPLPFYKR